MNSSYLDTSILRKVLLGHPLEKHSLQQIPFPWIASQYAIMEFYRSVVLYLVELYFEAEDARHISFWDACRYKAESFRSRDVKTLALTVCDLVESQGLLGRQASDKGHCRRRLRDLIFLIAWELRQAFERQTDSIEKCARMRWELDLKLLFQADVDRELIDFEAGFNDHARNRADCEISGLLTSDRISGASDCLSAGVPRAAWPKRFAKLVLEPAKTTCRTCAGIGDIVIAANAPEGSIIHSLDRSFSRIGRCLQREAKIHPSLAQLKKRADSTKKQEKPSDDRP